MCFVVRVAGTPPVRQKLLTLAHTFERIVSAPHHRKKKIFIGSENCLLMRSTWTPLVYIVRSSQPDWGMCCQVRWVILLFLCFILFVCFFRQRCKQTLLAITCLCLGQYANYVILQDYTNSRSITVGVAIFSLYFERYSADHFIFVQCSRFWGVGHFTPNILDSALDHPRLHSRKIWVITSLHYSYAGRSLQDQWRRSFPASLPVCGQ